jgi:hypothetical protein
MTDATYLTLADAFPPWFWMVGVGLALGVSVLLVLWYLEHPGRSPWEDFGRRFDIPDDLSSLDPSASQGGDQPA